MVWFTSIVGGGIKDAWVESLSSSQIVAQNPASGETVSGPKLTSQNPSGLTIPIPSKHGRSGLQTLTQTDLLEGPVPAKYPSAGPNSSRVKSRTTWLLTSISFTISKIRSSACIPEPGQSSQGFPLTGE